MALTNERAELLSNYLSADKDRAEELLKLSPEDALAKINGDGYDFTAEEMNEFGKELADMVAKVRSGEELDTDALDQVAGGGPVGVIAAGAVVGFAIGCAVIPW